MGKICYWILMRLKLLVPYIPRTMHVWMVSRASAEAAQRGEW
jgi:hypothetical protein